jgi:predicted MFS family arabinose efflux permease
MPAAGRASRALALGALLLAVGVAFADSSIVVLALPDLLSQLGVSIGAVSWVVTSYNLALALAALALVRGAGRRDPRRLALAGGTAFLAASLACAAAPEIWSLVAFRTVQGLGAALLLVGALPLARRLASTPARGAALWTGASVFGAALGPALGGVLTESFGWRAIFVAQAPVAALAVAAVALVRAPEPDAPRAAEAPGPGRRAAGLSLALASAALVGLLFLAVVELVDVWRLSPLEAGIVVSVIPLATLAALLLSRRLGGGSVATGAILLAGGLLGMAFLPGRDLAWALAALAVAGLGYGLLVPPLARASLSGDASGARSLWLRHAGLVIGIVVLTPLLTADLASAGQKAELRGIAAVLDAPIPAGAKLGVAIRLVPVLARPARKELPDFAQALRADPQPAARGLGPQLDAVVRASVAVGFRRSFALAALFALLAAVPVALASGARAAPRPALAAAVVVAVALLGAELASGALAFGTRPRLLPACADRPPPAVPGGGQRFVLKGLDTIACLRHESREQLVADLARGGSSAVGLVGDVERWLGG